MRLLDRGGFPRGLRRGPARLPRLASLFHSVCPTAGPERETRPSIKTHSPGRERTSRSYRAGLAARPAGGEDGSGGEAGGRRLEGRGGSHRRAAGCLFDFDASGRTGARHVGQGLLDDAKQVRPGLIGSRPEHTDKRVAWMPVRAAKPSTKKRRPASIAKSLRLPVRGLVRPGVRQKWRAGNPERRGPSKIG
jgi:hypothetical protein